MRNKHNIVLFAALVWLSAAAVGLFGQTKPTVSTFTDSRDGRTYKAVQIGKQRWMAENLNYDIPDDTTDRCYGEIGNVHLGFDKEDNPIRKTLSDEEVRDNCVNYGRLYDWHTAMKACPTGWRVPSDDEFMTLVKYVGGLSVAEKNLNRQQVGMVVVTVQTTMDFRRCPAAMVYMACPTMPAMSAVGGAPQKYMDLPLGFGS